MFTEWTVSNFKSIRKKTTLKLAPLTVLTGTNSSGKTSFLQSILMVAQTARSRKGQPHLLLNGSLTRLGRFEEIRPHGSSNKNISIGWAYEHQYSKKKTPIHDMETGGLLRPAQPQEILSCTLGFSYGPGFTNSKADPDPELRARIKRPHALRLSDFDLDFSEEADKFANMGAHLQVKHNVRMKRIEEDSQFFGMGQSFQVDASLLEDYRNEIIRRLKLRPRGKLDFFFTIYGAEFDNFMPSDLLLQYDDDALTRMRCIDLLESALEIFRTGGKLPIYISAPTSVSKDLQQRIKSFLPDLEEEKQKNSASRAGSDDALIRARLEANEICMELESSFQPTPPEEWELEDFALPEYLSRRLKAIKSIFSEKLWYVGPLRAAPNAEYPLSDDPGYVGTTGEFTGAVLEAGAYDMVEAFVPGTKGDIDDLSHALNSWLEYLGLGVEIESEEHPTGHRIKIRQAGSTQATSLTHVGVGVSQILPILVQGLLAPEDSVLIFEQPELHLHPKSQSRLADFFIGLSQRGRQCIVETHSEHIINRLRRRMTEQSETIQDGIKIYFAEKKKTGTAYKLIEVDPQGSIQNWPENFFDESEIEIGEIIRAAARRRLRGREK